MVTASPLARDAAHRAAGGFSQRAQGVERRDDFAEFARVLDADVHERGEVALGDREQAEFVHLHLRARDAGLGWLEHEGFLLAARERGDDGELVDLQALALDGDFLSARGGAQRFFLEFGLLHEPVREAAQQFEMRPAVLVIARPQPDLVRQHEADAALALAREQQQRAILDAGHHRHAARGFRRDLAIPFAPRGRGLLRAGQAARDGMASAHLRHLRAEGALDDAPVGTRGRNLAERRDRTARRGPE